MTQEILEVILVEVDDECGLEESARVVLRDPLKCLTRLQRFAGNYKAFARSFSEDTNAQQMALYMAEQTMEQSEKLHRQWQKAIERNHIIRMRLVQDDAFERLETPSIIRFGEEPNLKNVKLTETSDLNLAKVILSPLLAGQVNAAKTKKGKEASAQAVDPASEDEDDEDIEAARRALDDA